MKTLWQDLRYGFRMLWKTPGFTAVAVVTLALGIGANSAMFSAVSAFLLRPLPVEEPGGLVRVFEGRGPGDMGSFSYPDFRDYREQSGEVFEGLLAHRLAQAALSGNDRNDLVWGELVSGNYFDVLRVRPARGRAFLPEEDRTPGSHPVVVLSHGLWQKRFDADPSLAGKTVTLNGQPFTVVGVAPRGFTGTKFGLAMDFWVPLMMQEQVTREDNWLEERGDHRLELVGRLKGGVTRERAAAVLTTVAQRLADAHPAERDRNTKAQVLPETEGRYEHAAGTIKLGAGLALGVVAMVLLIACANVANLLLARSAARRREIGIRLALGASRARVVRQLLTESVLLSLLAGGLGLLLAFWAADLMQAMIPVLPYTVVLDFAPDARALWFTLLVSLLTGVVFGLAPALQASKTDLVPVLKNETVSLRQGGRRVTLKDLLVVTQVALSLVVLACGGLLVKSFVKAQSIDPGFQTERGLAVSLNPGLLGYDEARGKEFFRQLTERVEAVPGVERASVARYLQLGDSSSSTGPVVAEGQPQPAPGEGLSVLYNAVGPGHFDALRIPLLQGRDFSASDTSDAPRVCVVNQTLAERLWPGESALGKRLTVGGGRPREVVGVARGGLYRSLGESPKPFLYFPLEQAYDSGVVLLVRTSGDPLEAVSGVRGAIRSLDPLLPVYGVKTLKEHMTWALWGTRMAASLSLSFGLLALLLAASGLYSVMAYTVSRRTHEIGIRMALGAQGRDVLRLVAAQGMRLALAGVVVGLLAAFAVTRILSSILYGVSATDAGTFAAITALLACYLPARRATKVDPMVALRYE
jgi:macrolide transport system ATP-binding/permease protein